MKKATDLATKEWKKKMFFQSMRESFAALRADAEAWKEEVEERRLWDEALNDDLHETEE